MGDHGVAVVGDLDVELEELGTDIGEIHMLGNTWSLFFRDSDSAELEVCAPG